jgi:putative Mg2+ transporter-C (MgtC) family protein
LPAIGTAAIAWRDARWGSDVAVADHIHVVTRWQHQTLDIMNAFQNELAAGIPSFDHFISIVVRLVSATLLAGIIGYERESSGKSAGLRTHMLVALGSAIFVLAASESGMPVTDVSRVVQGVAAGIGFIGAGAILKVTTEREIQGLTTAAGIWISAAVGVSAAMGRWGLAAIGVALAWVILAVLSRLEPRTARK